ncbi:MarR family winged helix-turn-helix transcriptional regulator [Micromonospora globbae]|uniref:MarR family transcriptional regulator n=1 Tax=Micromonospora globbae TaxID=1894969 RepID=A0A420F847_9ACTN|nr:MarR family transcriptional regulator [Micromonospora globbae]RKF29102.1 MarR family transcriptional regulator [Micromonospora globbae]
MARPDLSSDAVRAAHELRVVFSRLRRRLREVPDRGGLTASQTSVLSRLATTGAASASDLAAAERIRPQSMAAILAPLVEQGLVARTPDPADGRRQLVSLTATGWARVRGDRQAREEWLARMLRERYTDAERRTIVRALALLDRLTGS